MKLKEQLAHEYDIRICTENSSSEIRDAYLSGFEKAREMAIQIMSDTPHAFFRLRDVGEEEV